MLLFLLDRLAVSIGGIVCAALFSVPMSLSVYAQDAKGQQTIHFPDEKEIVSAFETIVFGSEIEFVSENTIIYKWTSPLRLSLKAYREQARQENGMEIKQMLEKPVEKVHSALVQKHLNTLIKLTGLEARLDPVGGRKPNFRVHFVPRSQMDNPQLTGADASIIKRLALQGGCFFLFQRNRNNGMIITADIIVNSDRKLALIDHCLLEEMTQALGFPNDINAIWPTIFDQNQRITTLSRADTAIIKTLYDSRLSTGLARNQAMTKAGQILVGKYSR